MRAGFIEPADNWDHARELKEKYEKILRRKKGHHRYEIVIDSWWINPAFTDHGRAVKGRYGITMLGVFVKAKKTETGKQEALVT